MVHRLSQHNSVVVVWFGRIVWKNLIYKDVKLKNVRDYFIFRSENTAMDNGKYAKTSSY